MVHQVYICSNLNSSFGVHQYDQMEGCNIDNSIMWRFPSFALQKQVKFHEGEYCWLLPTTCPPTKLKPRTVCCQEGEDDEDMTPLDTTIAYKVSLLLLFHSDFWHNSLGSTCTCHYSQLLVGANISRSASPSKLLCHRHRLVIHTWDSGPSWSTTHEDGEHVKKVFGCLPPWPPA